MRAVQFMLDNHVTLINDNIGETPPKVSLQLMELARRAGCRFVLREVRHPRQVKLGTQLAIRMMWSYVGVGKLYSKYGLEPSLLDAHGHVITQTLTPVDPTSWLPGEIAREGAVDIGANLQTGLHEIGLALVGLTGRPSTRFAIDHPEADLRYRLAKLPLRTFAAVTIRVLGDDVDLSQENDKAYR